ncbi:MAG: sigma-70 family RNA polymerase sigma factor [Ruminococcaceae bacterium]|jgi:RNA polymerase sigma-70 factor (ECF subfamily)|nr:sigma-70 family RNA polymerase sigma factor [Oscillospiraceae bacterium]
MFYLLYMTLSEEGRNRVLSLWQEYCAALLRYAKKELGQSSPSGGPYGEAEDIVSEAFERLMIHYERYENLTDEQIKSILIRTVRNLSVDAYRRRKRLPVPLSVSEPDGEDAPDSPLRNPENRTPEEIVVSEDNIRRMKAMIRSLTPALRDVLEMRLIEERANGEIAEELGIPESVVRQRFSRARKALKNKWEEEEHG